MRKTVDRADRRSVRVSLTAEARRLASGVITDTGELMAPMTERLNPVERRRLSALLGKVLWT